MTQFEFRQWFHLLPDHRINAAEYCLPLDGEASHLRLLATQLSKPIGEFSSIILEGGPYASREEAETDAVRCRRALLLWALQRRCAIDFGDNKDRGGFTAAGAEWVSKAFGVPVQKLRTTVNGLDIFEKIEGRRFIQADVTAQLDMDGLGTASTIQRWYADSRVLTDKQALAAELYCASGFDKRFRSKFLTLMTAIEALLDHKPRSDAVLSIVKESEVAVDSSELPHRDKKSLLGSLSWLHTESIGQAGRRTANELLEGCTYGDNSPGKYFTECYELRSKIVHTGHVPKEIELQQVATELYRFVGDLLHAAIGISPD